MAGIPQISPIAVRDREPVRVALSSLEDARRVVFSVLEGLPDRHRSSLAHRLVAELRDAGCLAGSLEQYYSPAQLAKLTPRSAEYWCDEARSGRLGRVFRDGRSWWISASSVQRWLDAHAFHGGES